MKRFMIILAAIFFMVVFQACSLFLGPDPGGSPIEIFDSIWNDFDKTYALFDVKGIDWKTVYNNHVSGISSGMSDKDLFAVCSGMLGELNDAHVTLSSSFNHYNAGGRLDTSNIQPFSLDLIKNNYINNPATAGEGMFTYGTFRSNPDIGYIFIKGFFQGSNTGAGQNWAEDIDIITKALKNTNSIILDNRGNRGGLPANVNYIVSRFASKQKDYAQILTKNGPGRNDFSSAVNQVIKPEGTVYTKPIILLTNAQTISAGEWFTLALRSQSHVTHAGSATNGAFSLSLERYLVNGWTYTVSVQKVMDMQGICYEESGISPEPAHYKENTAENITLGIDDQLEYALSLCN